MNRRFLDPVSQRLERDVVLRVPVEKVVSAVDGFAGAVQPVVGVEWVDD